MFCEPAVKGKSSSQTLEENHIAATATTKRPTVDSEDNEFFHPNGRCRSIADDVPDYINPRTGYYYYGTRKCSKCQNFLTIGDFTWEESDKPAKTRVCIYCST